ncbi:hypothetical protein Emed_001298 [Eimeria media]
MSGPRADHDSASSHPQSAQPVAAAPSLLVQQETDQGVPESSSNFPPSRSLVITTEDAAFLDDAASIAPPSDNSWVIIERSHLPVTTGPTAAALATDAGFPRNKVSDSVKPQAARARSLSFLRLSLILAIAACAALSSRYVISPRFTRPLAAAVPHYLKRGRLPAASTEAGLGKEPSPRAHPKVQPVGDLETSAVSESTAVDLSTLQREYEQLMVSAAALDETWASVSNAARKTFAEHYLRVAKGGLKPVDCIYPLRRFVIALKRIDFASESPPKQRAFLTETKLLSLVLQAADRRLRFIENSLQFAQQTGTGSALHGLKRHLPKREKLQQITTDLKTFRYLALLLSKQGSAAAAAEAEAEAAATAARRTPMGAGTPAIPRVLAHKVANAILLLEEEAAIDKEVLNLFRQGLSKLHPDSSTQQHQQQQHQQQRQQQQQQEQQQQEGWIPLRTQERSFPAALFADVLRMVEEMQQTEAASRRENKMRPHKWTVEGSIDFLKFLEKRTANKLQTARTVKTEIQTFWQVTHDLPVGQLDLFQLAVELL